jgi:hypothetical protein
LGQFFFAEKFYNNVTQTSPDELAQFVTSWMDSYKKYSMQFVVATQTTNATDDDDDDMNNNKNTTNTTIFNATTSTCDGLQALNVILQSSFLQSLIDHCVIFVALQGDWARFVSEMLGKKKKVIYTIVIL